MTRVVLSTLVLVLGLAASGRLLAMPASVAGMVYYQRFFQEGARTVTTVAIRLNADGSYTGLFRGTVSQFPDLVSGVTPVESTADGRYTYSVLSPTKAQIRLTENSTTGATDVVHSLTGRDFADGRCAGTVDGFFGGSYFFCFMPVQPQKSLANTSCLVRVASGERAVAGFVANSAPVLIRAVGPGLNSFGVSGTLASPQLILFDASGRIVARANDGTESTAAALTKAAGIAGAFPLGARDAAILLVMPAGAYTASVAGATASDSGFVLIETYCLPYLDFSAAL